MADQDGGRDPKTGRILPGHTLNRRGRPPKIRSSDEAVLRAAQEPVTVTLKGGRRRRQTKLEVTAHQIVNQGAGGNFSAGKTVIELVRRAEERQARGSRGEELAQSDREIVERFIAKLVRILEATRNRDIDPS
jgi:hypothetical protein